MEYRRLGSSGLQLSALSFGAWVTFGNQLGRGEARELIATAWDHGITFFDNAENYAKGEAERIMGDVIADLRLPRDGYVVSSKACFGSVPDPLPTQKGLSRKHLFDACHAAHRRLRVDYLDLFFCHRPDPETPIEETVAVMDLLVRHGKVLYWGTSEWPAEAIAEARRIAREMHMTAPTMEQSEYNLLHRRRVQDEYRPLFDNHGMGLTTFSPLASGLLTGKYTGGIPHDSRLNVETYRWLKDIVIGQDATRLPRCAAFVAIARELGVAPSALAIAWCLRNPDVSSVILGASRPAQLVQNLAALELAQRIGADDWARIEAATA